MRFQRIYVGLIAKLHFLKKIPGLLLFFFFSTFCKGQISAPQTPVDLSTLRGFGIIIKKTQYFLDSTGHMPMSEVARSTFLPLKDFAQKDKIPGKLISYTFYLRFTLANKGNEPVIFYFYPGKLYRNFELYSVLPDATLKQEEVDFVSDGFIPIKVSGTDTTQYIVQGKFFKNPFNKVEATLVAEAHLQLFKNEMFQSLSTKKTAGIILSGMLLMMILVTLLNYFISRKIEFLYNSVYSLCMCLLIFLSSYLALNPSWFKGLFMSYLDLLLLIVGTVAYLAFARHFLNTRELHPKLNSFLKIETRIIVVMMLVYTLLFFGMDSYLYEPILEYMMKFVLLLAAVVFIVLAVIQKNRLFNYLAMGVATQIFFSFVSLGLSLAKSEGKYIHTSPIFYFELGIICSVIFFLLGLFYKSRHELIVNIKAQEALKLEAEKQSFENQLTVYKTQQEERNRISADMHDDLGAGMTSIRLYSELAKSKLGDKVIPEIEKISAFANDLINKMNAIIWSMSSQNDSLGNMVAYIRSYTIEYLDGTGITPRVTIPESLPKLIVNGTIRRNIFLVIKEALQNIVKHSNATEVVITMTKEPDGLALTIHDNGKGIDLDNLRQFSNGLKNMKKRMADLGLEFSIKNDAGTVVRLYGKTR